MVVSSNRTPPTVRVPTSTVPLMYAAAMSTEAFACTGTSRDFAAKRAETPGKYVTRTDCPAESAAR